jgi:hypothetical protein
MKKHTGIMHSCSASSFAVQSVRARKSAFPADRSHGSSSGSPAPSYCADLSDIGNQAAAGSGRRKGLHGNNCQSGRRFRLESWQ